MRCCKRLKIERRQMTTQECGIHAARFDIVDHCVRLMRQHAGAGLAQTGAAMQRSHTFVSDVLFVAAAEALVTLSVSLQRSSVSYGHRAARGTVDESWTSYEPTCVATSRRNLVHLTYIIRLLSGWVVRFHTLRMPRPIVPPSEYILETAKQHRVAVDTECRRLFSLFKRLVRVYDQAYGTFPRRRLKEMLPATHLAKAYSSGHESCIFAVLSSFRVTTFDFIAALTNFRPRGFLSTHCGRCHDFFGNTSMKTTAVVSGALRQWPDDAYSSLLRSGPSMLQITPSKRPARAHVCRVNALRFVLPLLFRAASSICGRVPFHPQVCAVQQSTTTSTKRLSYTATELANRNIRGSSVRECGHAALKQYRCDFVSLLDCACDAVFATGTRPIVGPLNLRESGRMILGRDDSDSRLGATLLSTAAKLVMPASAPCCNNVAQTTHSVHSAPGAFYRMLPSVCWPRRTSLALERALIASTCRASGEYLSSRACHPGARVAGSCCLKALAALCSYECLYTRDGGHDGGHNRIITAMPKALGAAFCLLQTRGWKNIPLLVAVADIVETARLMAEQEVAAAFADGAAPGSELLSVLRASHVRSVAIWLLQSLSDSSRVIRIHALRIFSSFTRFYLVVGPGVSPVLDIFLAVERMPIVMASERPRNVLLRRMESLVTSEKLPWVYAYAAAHYVASLFHVRYSRLWPVALRNLTMLSRSRGPGGGKFFRSALRAMSGRRNEAKIGDLLLWQHYWILWPVLWSQAHGVSNHNGFERSTSHCWGAAPAHADIISRGAFPGQMPGVAVHRCISPAFSSNSLYKTIYCRTNMTTHFALVWNCLAAVYVSSVVEARGGDAMPCLVLCLKKECRACLLGTCHTCRFARRNVSQGGDPGGLDFTQSLRNPLLFFLAKLRSPAQAVGHGKFL